PGGARGKRRRWGGRPTAPRTRLAAWPEVGADESAQAEERIAQAETARKQAEAEVERLHALAIQARQWVDLQARLATSRQRWGQAQRLLTDAPAIERDVQRLQELRDVLPRLQTTLDQRNQIRTSEEKTKHLATQKQKLSAQLGQLDHAREQARQKRTSLESMIAADEQRQREVVAQSRKAAELLARLTEHD